MPGITELDQLLAQMAPVADPVDYVFANVQPGRVDALLPHALMLFREAEATTLILPVESVADDVELATLAQYRRITLTVHSSLDAVGLTSAISQALSRAGIPANVVAAFFHDHVFVPSHLAANALEVLQSVSRAAVVD